MKPEEEGALRITLQFRSGDAMVYDLKDKTSRLTLRVSERRSSSDPGNFRVDAATKNGPDAIVITGWGATRADALREAARFWSEGRDGAGLPSFDWESVTRALSAVRAV